MKKIYTFILTILIMLSSYSCFENTMDNASIEPEEIITNEAVTYKSIKAITISNDVIIFNFQKISDLDDPNFYTSSDTEYSLELLLQNLHFYDNLINLHCNPVLVHFVFLNQNKEELTNFDNTVITANILELQIKTPTEESQNNDISLLCSDDNGDLYNLKLLGQGNITKYGLNLAPYMAISVSDDLIINGVLEVSQGAYQTVLFF